MNGENTRKTTRVYVTLDCMLDTRLAVLDSINKHWSKKMVTSDGYYKRMSDDFSKIISRIDMDQYKKAWDNRNAETIANRVAPTFLDAILHGYVREHIIDASVAPFNGDVKFIINTYPYEVDEKGKEALRFKVRDSYMSEAEIVYYPPEIVTPMFIRDNYDDVYMYEFNTWMELHAETLIDNPMPQVQVYAPLLMQRECKHRKYDIMEDKEFFEHKWASHMILRFQPISFFCMHLETGPEEEKKED